MLPGDDLGGHRQQRGVTGVAPAVSFLASIGLRTLLTAARAQAARGGKMVLMAPNDMVRKTLELAGVESIVPIVDDWETARASLQSS